MAVAPHTPKPCERCGRELEVLHRPLRRLRWSKHWWRGASSLFSQPLRICPGCGSLYDYNGQLVAAGAAETEVEMRARRFRGDMVALRDGFGAVVLASGMTVAWTLLGPLSYDLAITILSASVGAVSLMPFGYFARKARAARREIKRLKQARREGKVLE
jgi:hypothetical protein